MTWRWRPRTWLRIGVVAWAVLLLFAAVHSARNGEPTARDQTTIVEALPTVDRALAAVVEAAGGSGQAAGGSGRVVVGITGYERTQARCEAGNRDGERYRRSVLVYTLPGQESDLVDRVARSLPGRARVTRVADRPVLSGDVGFYVKLAGGMDGPGVLRFTADTGCRFRGGAVPGALPADSPSVAGAPAAVNAALGRLGSAPAATRTEGVACPSGGRMWTVTVTAARPGQPLAAAVPAGVAPLLAREDVVAFVDAGVGVALRLGADDLRVTASVGCR